MRTIALRLVDRLWDKALALAGALYVLLPLHPANMLIPMRDSGVFLYIGWRILNGELPYRDVWDHKPPLIYYLDALGLALADGHRWGVWLIELVSLTLAATLGLRLIRRMFGGFTAVLATLIWLFSLLIILDGGNLSEEYVLPLQFLCLLLAADIPHTRFASWRGLALGLAGGLMFLLKQNTIGIAIAIGIYLLFDRLSRRQGRQLLGEAAVLLSGGLAVLVGAGVFFARQGALPHFLDAALVFNVFYIFEPAAAAMTPLAGLLPLITTGLVVLAAAGALVFLAGLVRRKPGWGSFQPLILLALFDIPFEVALTNLSLRSYAHYNILLLPSLTLLAAFAIWFGLEQLGKVPAVGRFSQYRLMLTAGLLLALAGPFALTGIKELRYYRQYGSYDPVAYLKSHTTPADRVLFWGAEAGINFNARRASVSRYVYQFPLYQPGYTNENRIDEFVDEIIANPPRLIIYTHSPGMPLFHFPYEDPDIQSDLKLIRETYRFTGKLWVWDVYEYITPSH